MFYFLEGGQVFPVFTCLRSRPFLYSIPSCMNNHLLDGALLYTPVPY